MLLVTRVRPSVTVTLDNTAPEVTGESRGDDVALSWRVIRLTISAMVSEGCYVLSADVTALNADDSTLSLMDAAVDGMYSGSVMVTADGDAAADG